MMRKIKLLILFIILLTGLGYAQTKSRTINSGQYILYIPSGVSSGQKYPLVIAFSPSAEAESMINTWKNVSEKYKWLILASKQSRNGMDMKKVCDTHVGILKMVTMNYPVDSSKIIATGFSGGGMTAHAFAMYYPKSITAVVTNTGMIHESFTQGNNANFYPRRKLVVFLASPSGFRYADLKKDRGFLQGLGWKTKWVEFEGGHSLAPDAAYQKAAQWLAEQL